MGYVGYCTELIAPTPHAVQTGRFSSLNAGVLGDDSPFDKFVRVITSSENGNSTRDITVNYSTNETGKITDVQAVKTSPEDYELLEDRHEHIEADRRGFIVIEFSPLSVLNALDQARVWAPITQKVYN